MSHRILCVDDEENLLIGLQRTLRKQFQVEVAVGGAAGLRKLETEGPFAAVVADMQMPEMNGIEFLKQVETRWPDTIRLMLTGNADQKTAVDALNQGHVFRFLNKPCQPEQLIPTLESAVNHYLLLRAERDLLENTLTGAVRVLSEILSALKPRTRMAPTPCPEQIRHLCQALQIGRIWEVEIASLLANVGYATLPPAVLLKLSVDMVLAEPEQKLLRNLPTAGADLVSRIPRLENVAKIIRYSQKNFDGSGLPDDACAGADIPIGARALRVLQELARDEYCRMPMKDIVRKLREKQGIYDPGVLDAALSLPEISATVIAQSSASTQASPQSPATGVGSPAKATHPSRTVAASNKPRRDTEPVSILILDDKPVVVEKLRSSLAGTTWKVLAATTAEEALEMCRHETVDVVVVSLALMGDGVLLFKRNLQAQIKHRVIPVFGLAARATAPDRERMQELGLAAVVTKPIDCHELRRRVSQALNLDTTYKYFQYNPKALVITLPTIVSPTLADAIFVNLRVRFEEALDEGLDTCVLDLAQVATVDRGVIDLVLSVIQSSNKYGFRITFVSSQAFNVVAAGFEETRRLQLNATLEEAFARFDDQSEAA